MNNIKNLAQLDELVGTAKKNAGASNINSYLLADDLEHSCASGGIFYEEKPAGLLVYRELSRVLQLFLYINPDIPFVVTRKSKPITCELMGMNQPSGKSKKVVDALVQTGFVLNAASRRMSKRLDSQPLPQHGSGWRERGLQVCRAGQDQIKPVLALFEDTFDPIKADLPSADELVGLIEVGQLLYVPGECGDIAGALQVEVTEQASWSRHYAVRPRERGKSIGRALSVEYHRLAAEKGSKVLYLWVFEESAALFHSHFGYDFDGRFLEQYLLE